MALAVAVHSPPLTGVPSRLYIALPQLAHWHVPNEPTRIAFVVFLVGLGLRHTQYVGPCQAALRISARNREWCFARQYPLGPSLVSAQVPSPH